MNNASFGETFVANFRTTPHNQSYVFAGVYDVDAVDSVWIIVGALLFFTIQTGLALIEAGIVSKKNEVNVMMKKIVDISAVGIAYWMYGFALMYGRGKFSNPFFGFGDFFVNASKDDALMKQIFQFLFFQISFATSSTTIASGGGAERFNFAAHVIFCFLSCIIYSIGGGWIWSESGFLKNLGAVDFAGSGPIHILGGASALALAIFIGPRNNRYAKGTKPLKLGNPFNLILGLLIIWWGWIAFNAGSSYGMSNGKWDTAARAGLSTVIASMAAGVYSVIFSLYKNKMKANVLDVVSGILCALVSINAGCFAFSTFSSVIVGVCAAILCFIVAPIIDNLRIDDIGVTSIHLVGGIWGQISVGLFGDPPTGLQGLFMGGGCSLLLIQLFSAFCLTLWSISMTFIFLFLINKVVPVRISKEEEELGCDLAEHFDDDDDDMAISKFTAGDCNARMSETSTSNENSIESRYTCACLHNNYDKGAFGKRQVYHINNGYQH